MGRRNAIAVLCFLVLTTDNAQAQPLTPPPAGLTSTVSRTVSAVITVAISAFFVLVFLCVLLNQCRGGGGEGGPQGSVGRRRRGLDPAAVAALPVVPYAEVRMHKSGALECAVCLTEFVAGEDLRLLPQCSHAFHPDCIDPWLEAHVTCPLCRANLEKLPSPSPAPAALPSSPETEHRAREAVAAARVEVEVESDEDARREEAVELERLRSVRRAARMPRSHSTGHSLSTAAATATSPSPSPAVSAAHHERFTVRLPPHVRDEVLKSRRLRHATSLVVGLRSSSCEGSSRGGGSWHGARRWPSFLARTVSWARAGGEGSVRRGGVGTEPCAKGARGGAVTGAQSEFHGFTVQ